MQTVGIEKHLFALLLDEMDPEIQHAMNHQAIQALSVKLTSSTKELSFRHS